MQVSSLSTARFLALFGLFGALSSTFANGDEDDEALRFAPGQLVVEFAEGVVLLPPDPGHAPILVEGIEFNPPELRQVLLDLQVASFEAFAIPWRRIEIDPVDLATGYYPHRPRSFRDFYLVHFPPELNLLEIADALHAIPLVKSVGRNPILLEASYAPGDTLLYRDGDDARDYQWNLNNTGGLINGITCEPGFDIGILDAWDIQDTCEVRIGFADSGIDRAHPDLEANIDTSFARNFTHKGGPVDPDSWDDETGHGTQTAGIIGGTHSADSLGVAGICGLYSPSRPVLVPLKVATGTAYSDSATNLNTWLVDALSYASDNWPEIPIVVLNMILNYKRFPAFPHWYLTEAEVDLLASAVNNAYHEGVFLPAASGNKYASDVKRYPAAFHRMTVGTTAVGCDSSREDSFNRGEAVSLSAPGSANALGDDGVSQIVTTKLGGGYTEHDSELFGRTSAAVPHVGGAAGLLLSHTRSLTNEDLREVLQSTAIALGDANLFGHGLLRVDRALSALDTTILIHDSTTAIGTPVIWNGQTCVQRRFRHIDPDQGGETQYLRADIYQFESAVTLDSNEDPNHIPLIWIRGRESLSARPTASAQDIYDALVEPYYGEVISVSASSATLRGYSYKLYEDVDCEQFLGWFPMDPTNPPNQAILAYSYLADPETRGVPVSSSSDDLALQDRVFRMIEQSVVLRFTSPSGRDATLRIHDVGGRVLREVELKATSPGQRTYRWDGRDHLGVLAGSGIYFATVTEGTMRETARIIVVR